MFFIIFTLPSLANEKFLINGNTLIYDTFKASDETQAEINWEDTNILASPVGHLSKNKLNK